MKKQSLGDGIDQGLIQLIPKVGDHEITMTWMPITLLNVSYKMLVKALALRI
jgi:hypothetical protein